MMEAQRQTNEIGLICGNMKIIVGNRDGEVLQTKIRKGGSIEVHMNFFWLIYRLRLYLYSASLEAG